MKKHSSKNKKRLKNVKKRDKNLTMSLHRKQIFKVFYFKIVRKIKTAKKVKNVTRIKKT